MELLYLAAIFAIIVILLAIKRPLYQAMLGGLLATALLYRLSPMTMLTQTGKVFTDWMPDEFAAQKKLGQLRTEGENRITWDAVDGAIAYAVFNNGRFVGMTTSTSYDVAEGDIKNYTVRAANSHGGFGEASNTTTSGIDEVETGEAGEAVNTAFYSVQGERVSSTYRGIVIEVKTMTDGSKTVRKDMRQ